jgi:hypothetical protein
VPPVVQSCICRTVSSFARSRDPDDVVASHDHSEPDAPPLHHRARRQRALVRPDARRRVEKVGAACRLTRSISSPPTRCTMAVRTGARSWYSIERSGCWESSTDTPQVAVAPYAPCHLLKFCCLACAAASQAATDAAMTASTGAARCANATH